MANGARGDPGVNGGGDTARAEHATDALCADALRASSVPLTGVLLMIRADPTILRAIVI